MTKADLSARSSLSVTSISAYEGARTTPTSESVDRLGVALNFPTGFFYMGEAPIVHPEAVSFRALSRMSAAERDTVTATAGLATELDRWIAHRFTRPEPSVPDLSGADPVAAAEALRIEWGLGAKPIGNLVHLVESKGVRVYSLGSDGVREGGRNFDALSMWWEDRPFIFLNTAATPERGRFNVAHELAHLVLHHHGPPSGQQAEREANRFAGSFLVPASDLAAHSPRRTQLRDVVAAKARWGVSPAALVYRLHEEGIIHYWRYRDLNIQIRTYFGQEEPSPTFATSERSQVLAKVFAELRNRGGRPPVARDLMVSVDDLDALLFSHVHTLVRGGGQGGEQATESIAPLRVME